VFKAHRLSDHSSLGVRVIKKTKQRTLERESLIKNLLVRVHFIFEMICWTGLAPWEFEFPFPVAISTFLSDL